MFRESVSLADEYLNYSVIVLSAKGVSRLNNKCNNGMTMIEILVAFVMLTLVMVILYSSIKFASNLLKEATDIDRRNAAFERAVVEKFNNGYKLGAGDKITYSFKVEGQTGDSDPTIDFELYKANVNFKRDELSGEYEVKPDETGNNVRRLFLFSVGN